MLLAAGCHTTHAIRPSELPKLNGSHAGETGHRRGRVVEVEQPSRRVLVTPDGRTVEVEGEVDATVILVDGRRFDFEHPVLAEIAGDKLTVRGSNQAFQFDQANISGAEVAEFNSRKTNAIAVTLTVAGSILLGVGIAAALIAGI